MNNTGISKRTFVISAVSLAIIAFFITIALVGGSGEDRAGDDASVTFTGPEGATIYIGSMNEEGNVVPDRTESISGEDTVVSVETGEVTFVTSRGEGFYPWEKTLTLERGGSTKVYPLMLPQEPALESVEDNQVETAFSSPVTLPSSNDPRRVSEEGGLEMYVDNEAVMVTWSGAVENMPEFFCPGNNVSDCFVQQAVSIEQLGSIEHVDFFGAENQFLVVDRGNTISVIEIDRRDSQNIQSLYEGTAPTFRVIDNQVYVADNGETWRVDLPGYTQ